MYKVGDKVIVKSNLVVGKDYKECTFVGKMEKYKGKIFEIVQAFPYHEYTYYRLEKAIRDYGRWSFVDDMLLPATKEALYNALFNDKITFEEYEEGMNTLFLMKLIN